MNVLIIGASHKAERYSYRAMKMLEEFGHDVVLMHPKLTTVEGRPVLQSFAEISSKIDTVTLYVNAGVSAEMRQDLISLKPRRVIFNPGAENEGLFQDLSDGGVQCLNACTLVLLRTHQF